MEIVPARCLSWRDLLQEDHPDRREDLAKRCDQNADLTAMLQQYDIARLG